MKNLIAALLTLSLSLTATGCAGNTAKQTEDETPKTSATVYAQFDNTEEGDISSTLNSSLSDTADDDTSETKRDEFKGYFFSESNIPELSNQGVKGLLKEAYYTTDGNLAVTLNLSNGTPKDMEVTNVGIRIFNDKDQTVAQDKLTVDDFQIEYVVKANGYGEMYFEIDKAHVVKADDPLKVLGTTLEISCVPTDGTSYEAPQTNEFFNDI